MLFYTKVAGWSVRFEMLETMVQGYNTDSRTS